MCVYESKDPRSFTLYSGEYQSKKLNIPFTHLHAHSALRQLYVRPENPGHDPYFLPFHFVECIVIIGLAFELLCLNVVLVSALGSPELGSATFPVVVVVVVIVVVVVVVVIVVVVVVVVVVIVLVLVVE